MINRSIIKRNKLILYIAFFMLAAIVLLMTFRFFHFSSGIVGLAGLNKHIVQYEYPVTIINHQLQSYQKVKKDDILFQAASSEMQIQLLELLDQAYQLNQQLISIELKEKEHDRLVQINEIKKLIATLQAQLNLDSVYFQRSFEQKTDSIASLPQYVELNLLKKNLQQLQLFYFNEKKLHEENLTQAEPQQFKILKEIEGLINFYHKKKQSMNYSAPFDGWLSEISFEANKTFPAHSEILTIFPDSIEYVRACLYEGKPFNKKPDDPVKVHLYEDSKRTVSGRIVSISKNMTPFPLRLSNNGGSPSYGRILIVKLSQKVEHPFDSKIIVSY